MVCRQPAYGKLGGSVLSARRIHSAALVVPLAARSWYSVRGCKASRSSTLAEDRQAGHARIAMGASGDKIQAADIAGSTRINSTGER